MKPVGFHVVFVFRKAVMFIRNDEPQNVPSGFTDLLQSYAAVLIDTGNHITAMEGLPYMASVRAGNRNYNQTGNRKSKLMESGVVG